MKYTQAKLRKELLSKIDEDNQMQLEKVERYLNLVEMFYKLDKYIEEEGLLVETINGSQKFLKTNPALQEKAKINAQILSIEKSFEFNVQTKHDSDGGDLI